MSQTAGATTASQTASRLSLSSDGNRTSLENASKRYMIMPGHVASAMTQNSKE